MTILQVAPARIGQLNVLIVIVEIESISPAGDVVIRKLMPFYPHLPVMLVNVSDNGFLAYAHFQTHTILALLQLEQLTFVTVDLRKPPEEELPF